MVNNSQKTIIVIVPIILLILGSCLYYFCYESNRYSEKEKIDQIQSLSQFSKTEPQVVIKAFMWAISHEDIEILRMTYKEPDRLVEKLNGITKWEVSSFEDIMMDEETATITVKTTSKVGLLFVQRNEKFKKIIPSGISTFQLEKGSNGNWIITQIGKS